MRASRQAIWAVTIVAVMAFARPASALFHLMEIEEVFFGTEECPNAQYVMLRMTAGGQTVVNNLQISTADAAGTASGNFGAFAGNVSNGADGAAILMGTAEAQGLFGIAFDHVTAGRLQFPAGRICFAGAIDCIAYGAFTGGNPGGGSPAPAPVLGMALMRNGNTGSDADDFELAPPMPQNNAGQNGTLGQQCPSPPTATPATTPPTATPAGATQTPTPTATRAPTSPATDYVCPCDCDRDRQVMVNELVTGVNIVLDNATIDSCTSADLDGNGIAMVNDLVSGVGAALNGCPELGTRRFSLNTTTSLLTAVLQQFGPFPTMGFTGFLELRAGVPNPQGVAFIDIVDTSEYLSILIPPQDGGADTVLCLRPRRDLLPLTTAGLIDCDGGTPLGFSAAADHNLGVVGACAGGDNAGAACTDDAGCPGGQCFNAADCAAATGMVEATGRPHAGVCNGPIVGAASAGDSGPGAVVIAQNGALQGLPAVLLMETALPCGDEGASGPEARYSFTTSISRSEILDFNNSPGATFAYETQGVNFSCRAWSEENGPGTLVLAVPVFDLELPVVGASDFMSVFTWDD